MGKVDLFIHDEFLDLDPLALFSRRTKLNILLLRFVEVHAYDGHEQINAQHTANQDEHHHKYNDEHFIVLFRTH